MKKYIFLILISTIFYACPNIQKNPNCSRGYYNFTIPVSFDPPDAILNIGDTITITSQFPNRLWDQDSTDEFIFDSIKFYTRCGIIKIDTFNSSKMSNSLELFEYIIDTVKYSYKKNNISFNIDHHYNGEEYFLEFKIVPKYKGVFYFRFSSSLNVYPELFEDQEIHSEITGCVIDTDVWAPYLVTNGGIGNNKEFLRLSPNPYYNTTAYDNWNGEHNGYGGVHLFKVE